MPRYEFRCENCGPFECWRPFNEAGAFACLLVAFIESYVIASPGFSKLSGIILYQQAIPIKDIHCIDYSNREVRGQIMKNLQNIPQSFKA
jgi:hypothetical protein